jgi:poly-gamma-glutamate synthesis protein (capsule biosynthesis protein)
MSSSAFLPISKSFSTDFAYDNRTFLPAVAGNEGKPSELPPRVMVLPHHLMASSIIARGISLLTGRPPKTIIILSPNHANIGQCDIISSKNKWDTPFGRISIDEELLNLFLKEGSVCLDDKAMNPEHGIAGLLPFIKYYLPNTKIVPLILKKEIDPVLLTNFTQKLISSPEDVISIASIDFSHGLSRAKAIEADAITEHFISTFNYSELLKLSSEYLDSPASLVSVLTMIESGQNKPHILVHSDSSSFNHSPESVTSYFLITGDYSNESDSFTLIFGGDVMLGRSVNTRILKYADFLWPFRKISGVLSTADLSFVNLEAPFRSGCPPTDQGMIFCADPRSVAGLISSGVDIVSLANNHIGNQGQEGLTETIDILSKAGVAFVGRESPAVRVIKGIKLSFLGFNDIPQFFPGISTSSRENIITQVSGARKDADIVIASFHWGDEYRFRSSRQEELAHLAIDSGADVVIGHHPHWVQEIETYKGKPIYYSLGNLVFDQMWSEETKGGILVRLTFSGKALVAQEELPVKIFDYGQPALEN